MSDQDSLVSELLKLIPGYAAYRRLESRREDDRLTRDFLCVRIKECKSALDQLTRQAVAEGQLERPTELEQHRGRLDLAQNRLAAAVEGYAAWFSQRSVDEKLLEKTGQVDANLVSLVDQIDSQLRAAVAGREPLDDGKLSEALDLLHSRIDRRTNLLQAGAAHD